MTLHKGKTSNLGNACCYRIYSYFKNTQEHIDHHHHHHSCHCRRHRHHHHHHHHHINKTTNNYVDKGTRDAYGATVMTTMTVTTATRLIPSELFYLLAERCLYHSHILLPVA
jgi:hypothetical protein